MSHQEKIIQAFLSSKKTRLSGDQLVQLTGLEQAQVTSACYQLIIKDIGFTRAVVKGKERKGLYEYHAPDSDERPARAPEAAAPLEEKARLNLSIVAKLPEGWSIGINQSDGKAYRVEPLS